MQKTYGIRGGRSVAIRTPVKEGVPACLGVLRSIASEKVYIMTEEVTDSRRESLERMIAGEFRDQLFVVADLEGAVVGTLGLLRLNQSPKTDHARSLGMGIISEYRGIGIGTAPMECALEWSRSRGLYKMVLDVFAINESAIRLYRRFGFEIEGTGKKLAKIKGEYVDLMNMGLFL